MASPPRPRPRRANNPRNARLVVRRRSDPWHYTRSARGMREPFHRLATCQGWQGQLSRRLACSCSARKARSEQLRSNLAVSSCKLQHVGTAGRTGELFKLSRATCKFAVHSPSGAATTHARSSRAPPQRNARAMSATTTPTPGAAPPTTPPRWTCRSCNYDHTSQSEVAMTVCATCCTPKAPPAHRRSVSFSDVETVDTI